MKRKLQRRLKGLDEVGEFELLKVIIALQKANAAKRRILVWILFFRVAIVLPVLIKKLID